MLSFFLSSSPYQFAMSQILKKKTKCVQNVLSRSSSRNPEVLLAQVLLLLLLLLFLLLLCSWTRAYVASLPKNRPVVTIGPCGSKYFPVSSLVGNLLEYFGIQVKYECHCCLAANSRIGIYNGNCFLTDNSTTVSQILMVFSAEGVKKSVKFFWPFSSTGR